MGTSNKKQNKGTQAVLAEQLAAGALKHFATGIMPVGGARLTLAEIEAKLVMVATLRSDVETARAAHQAKVAAETALLPELRVFMSAFVRIVRGSFGDQPDVLADFGLKPTKSRTPLTIEQKATAAAKGKATRVARGTKGSKAKQAIHGDVVGVVVTPVLAGQPEPTPHG